MAPSTHRVFVHGNPETSALWTDLTAALDARGAGPVITLSPPGFGAPVPEGFAATQGAYLEWLVAELESMGAPVDLVGHDWGAGHVYGAVAARPDLIRTWAADCVGLVHPDYVWHDAAQVWQTRDAGEEMVAAMLGGDPGERAAGLAALGIREEVAAEIAAAQDDTMAACILTLYRSAVQPAMRELGDRLVAAERRPGLVINATEDHYAGTQEMLADMAARLDADVFRLDGLGHWWMFAGADAAADALLAHWRTAD